MNAPVLQNDKLGKLRLLTALDALLVEGSVARAAEKLGISAPVMSRLLGQLRELYGDPIMIRRGGRLVPTTLAEDLRLRLRAMVHEAETLLDRTLLREGNNAATTGMYGIRDVAPVLSARPAESLEGAPAPEAIARKLARASGINDPRIRLARLIALTGSGVGRSRPLTAEEADEAFSIVLHGEADPVQIGALLMVLNYRGLSALELAGLARAARRYCRAREHTGSDVDLDWPVYVSPRNRNAPWYLHSARLTAAAGIRVLLHGCGAPDEVLSDALRIAGVKCSPSLEAAAADIGSNGIAFAPLQAFAPQLAALMNLYGLFELRTPVHQVLALLNPLGAPTVMTGVPGASHRELQRDAAALLGFRNFTAIGQYRDVAQATPFRATTLYRIVDTISQDQQLPPEPEPQSQPVPHLSTLEFWQAVWDGTVEDLRAEKIIVSTTAIALLSCSRASDFPSALEQAKQLWQQRRIATSYGGKSVARRRIR